jgi:hypothetical protein
MTMHMLMRIQVRRIATQEPAELGDLVVEFFGDSFGIVSINHTVKRFPVPIAKDPFPEVEVETDADSGVLFGVGGGLGGGGPTDHQAGAGKNASFGAFDNTAIDSFAETEVVGVDDERTCHSD